MATGARDGEAEETLPKNFKLVRDAVGLILGDVGGCVHRLVEVPEAGAHHALVGFVGWIDPRLEQITGDLLPNESVIGKVIVEGANHPVAVSPCFADGVVKLMAAGLGVANEVQPVPPPAFAETGRCEIHLDQTFPMRLARIGFEGGDDRRVRRQADQVVGKSPHLAGGRGVVGGFESDTL